MAHKELSLLNGTPRLVMECDLRPLDTDRFQPTGFPDLGPAQYELHDGTKKLLVESAQSMANRLELALWDAGGGHLIDAAVGLPYIRVVENDNEEITNSILEAHRINSEYILKKGSEFAGELIKEIKLSKDRPVKWNLFYKTLFKYDPNCLIHGCFLEEIDGRLRVTRALSSFVEATDVSGVESGGMKINRVEPSLKGGLGNVPYHRVEFTARRITAFFNLDLALLRSYGLPEEAVELLIALSLLKIRRFLASGLRLRTACDLVQTNGISVTAPEKFKVPKESKLEDMVRTGITACAKTGLFLSEPVKSLSLQS